MTSSKQRDESVAVDEDFMADCPRRGERLESVIPIDSWSWPKHQLTYNSKSNLSLEI